MSSMKAFRPKNILLCGDTPLDQCLCDRCENCEQILKSLLCIGMKEIPSNRYDAIDKVVCSERYTQVGSHFTFPRKQCLMGECNICGENRLKEVILSANSEFVNATKTITFRQ